MVSVNLSHAEYKLSKDRDRVISNGFALSPSVIVKRLNDYKEQCNKLSRQLAACEETIRELQDNIYGFEEDE